VETFTFLFTDIEGSTALVGRLGEGLYGQLLAGHHALIRSALAAHGGREVDTQGDAFFAVFASPRACVAAVLEMQRAVEAHRWPGGAQVRVRMGVHAGEAEKNVTGLVGVEVHRAARVAAVGYGGQVLLSEAAAVLVRDGLPPGASLTDLGVHRLKDLGHPALPNNLPAQLSAFIGWEKELAEVRAMVESSRLVTLTGAARGSPTHGLCRTGRVGSSVICQCRPSRYSPRRGVPRPTSNRASPDGTESTGRESRYCK